MRAAGAVSQGSTRPWGAVSAGAEKARFGRRVRSAVIGAIGEGRFYPVCAVRRTGTQRGAASRPDPAAVRAEGVVGWAPICFPLAGM